MGKWVCFGVLGLSLAAPAATAPRPAAPDNNEAARAVRENTRLSAQGPRVSNRELSVARPFAEYRKVRYVLMGNHTWYDSAEAKTEIVKNLPKDVNAVILAGTEDEATQARAYYSSYIEPSRLSVVVVPGGVGFWARDTLPIPVFDPGNKLLLVAANYFRPEYHPGNATASFFHLPLLQNDYYFEGGDFLADRARRCFVVDNERATQIPDATFQSLYGCGSVVRLPFASGIGHVDEHIKILSDTQALTDETSYAEVLNKLGYQTTLLPTPSTPYGTYANALLVNQRVFVPVYGESGDTQAIQAYQAAGLDVVPINSVTLSSQGLGSLHCITMTYPEGGLDALKRYFGR